MRDVNVEALEKLAEQGRGMRSRFEPGWFLNLAFYVGEQWLYWNRGKLDRPSIPKHRLLITDNRIMPVVQTRIAKQTKQRPIWTVTPQSPEDSDIEAAELGEVLLEGYFWKHLYMQDKLLEALYWANICGAGFWKICWDRKSGDTASIAVRDGEPMTGEDGRLIRMTDELRAAGIESEDISQGDIAIEVRSPFQIIPDPLGDAIHSCEWIIEEVVQSQEYVRSRYGVELDADTEASPGPVEARYFPTWQLGGSSSYRGVMVREYWQKPTSDNPRGLHVVWAKHKILHQGDNPYGDIPYVAFSGVPVPGRFWPSSVVEQLRGPQVELNKIKSQIRENAQRIGNPALLKNRLSNVEYTGVPGEEVLYDDTTPNSTPTYLQPPSMPSYVVQEIDRIEASIREISGQHEVTSSQVPAGVTAASAINLLLEQDDTRLGPSIHDMEAQLSRAGQKVLQLVAEYYNDERIVRIAGDDGDWDIFGFKGEQLKGSTQVEVQAGSAFPTSKAAKQAAMTQTLTLFIQNGIPLDPRSLRKFFRDYQVGGLENLFAELTEDVRQVKRENRIFYQGQFLPPNWWDDHEAHISDHMEEMKSSRWFRADGLTKQIFELHLQQHQQMLAQNQEPAPEQQMEQERAQIEAASDERKMLLEQQKAEYDMESDNRDMQRLQYQFMMRQRDEDMKTQRKAREVQAQRRRGES